MFTIVLFILGLVVAFGGFIFAALNMGSNGMSFRKHGYAMAIMGIGGLIIAISLALGAWSILSKFSLLS